MVVQSVFPIQDDRVLEEALDMARQAHKVCLMYVLFGVSVNKIYGEKWGYIFLHISCLCIPMIALWCHHSVSHVWNTTAYYSYYFDYLLSLHFKRACRSLGIYFR